MTYTPAIADSLTTAIDAAYAARPDPRRSHLGASVMGKECMRAVWYQMHWAVVKRYLGRMLRLFQRGRDEEDRFVSMLRKVGANVVTVDARTGKQVHHSRHAGHMGGSRDAAITHLPGFNQSDWFLGEFKTCNKDSFRDLAGDPSTTNTGPAWPDAKGVRVSKPEHYVQMQSYMHWSQGTDLPLSRALYGAVCKDNDHLYFEVVEYDPEFARDAEERGEAVIYAEEPPLKIGRDASFFKCKMCDFSKVCHGKDFAEPNCRTCAHSTAERTGDARWSCAYWKQNSIPLAHQEQGCPHHVYNPAFMLNHGTYMGGNEELNYAEYRDADGDVFRNGTARIEPLVFASTALPFANRRPPPGEVAVVETMGGTYVESTQPTAADIAITKAADDYYARAGKSVKAPRAAPKSARR